MAQPLIINIQRFSIHDGEGIRTTVFFKGCPLTCAWCHNREACSFKKELMLFEDRCISCGSCISVCPAQAVSFTGGEVKTDRNKCIDCGKCVDSCFKNARKIIGEEIKAQDLAKKLIRDLQFYETSEGGVTLSGGEVMAQDLDYLLELLKKLHSYGCNIAVDTCGDVPMEKFEAVLPYVDTFLYDIKAVTPEIHFKYTGRSNERILENLKELERRGAAINIRIPVVPGVNDGGEMVKILQFVKENINPIRVNLLPYHNIGTDKAKRIGKGEIESFRIPGKKEMEELQTYWIQNGFHQTLIGG